MEAWSPKSRCFKGALLLFSFWGLLAISGISWLIGILLQSLSLSSHIFLPSVSPRGHILWGYKLLALEPTLIQYNFILTNYICKDYISKYDHVLRFCVDMNFGGGTLQHRTSNILSCLTNCKIKTVHYSQISSKVNQ